MATLENAAKGHTRSDDDEVVKGLQVKKTGLDRPSQVRHWVEARNRSSPFGALAISINFQNLTLLLINNTAAHSHSVR
jgi:hypothetical protein